MENIAIIIIILPINSSIFKKVIYLKFNHNFGVKKCPITTRVSSFTKIYIDSKKKIS